MKVVSRLLAFLGVVFLAVTSGLYLVQADRAADFEANTPTVTGTVVRTEARSQSDIRDLFRQRSVTVPVIDFVADGKKHEFIADTARGHYRVGDTVSILYLPQDSTTPADDIVLIKGQDISTLRAVAAGYAVAAVLAAWFFAFTGLIQLRRNRERRRRGNRPADRPDLAANAPSVPPA